MTQKMEFELTLPNDKILVSTKLKTFADDKLNDAERMISFSDGAENTVGKEENAGYQHFLLFTHCFFVKALCYKVFKSRHCVVKS